MTNKKIKNKITKKKREWEGSTASASLDDHVVIVFKDDLVVLVDVEHRDRRELGGHATCAWNCRWIHRMNQRLHDGVVCCVEVVRQWERTVTVAVVSVVAGRGDDPVIPPDVTEIDVE